MSADGRIIVGVAAIVLYFVLTWVAFVITLLIGGGLELTLPSFPWSATIFWWMGLAVFVWYIPFGWHRGTSPNASSSRASAGPRTDARVPLTSWSFLCATLSSKPAVGLH